jgi:hypothetical protein
MRFALTACEPAAETTPDSLHHDDTVGDEVELGAFGSVVGSSTTSLPLRTRALIPRVDISDMVARTFCSTVHA